MKKPNTHCKEPNEYAYHRDKLEEYGIDDIKDDHVGVTSILDSQKEEAASEAHQHPTIKTGAFRASEWRNRRWHSISR